ncbi:MAG TPA: ethanolamine ammonia-lyase subunit EutC [Bryobacteraceae bacterium]|nr:ethanolamine ammonia-lyase subunit EutC [Bryobacteraceae bacterium]
MNLRDFTPARVDMGRAGHSLPTRELLDFQLAHAKARDAVHTPLDVRLLAAELREKKLEFVTLASAAPDRITYLRRPDLGRQLSHESRPRLTGACDVVFIIADGLSALAVHRHSVPLLDHVLPRLDGRIAPIAIVEQGRVAIGDEIGELLHAQLAIVLIGERPGLSSPDSMGIYVTWQPRIGRTEAERNCISNIRAEGLSYPAAAQKLLFFINEARRLKLTGFALKEDSGRLLSG